MLGTFLKILAMALCILVDGKHQGPESVESPRTLVKQNQFIHEAAQNLPKLSKLLVTHIAGTSFRQNKVQDVPEVKHKKKPGEGYEPGSPLFEKQEKRKATEELLLPHPTGRQLPPLIVIVLGVILGVMVLTIAGCINRNFLVRRYLASGDLPVSPNPFNPDMSSGFPKPTLVDASLPPSYQQQQPIPVSMMPGQVPQQYPAMQQVGPPPATTWNTNSMSISLRNSAPGSGNNLGVMPPPNSASPAGRTSFLPPAAVPAPGGPTGAIYASVPPQLPPQGPGSLPPPKSNQYSSMPPADTRAMM